MAGTPGPSRVPNASGGGGADDCDLRFRTTLASPIRSVVELLSDGDELTVVAQESEGYPIAVATRSDGEAAGTIVDRLAQLLDCLARGRRFIAVVAGDPVGGVVVVNVRPN